MFFCATCGSGIIKKGGEGIPCFGPGKHIDPRAVSELAGKSNVRILRRNGVECFIYDTKGDKGETTEISVPLIAHPLIIQWDLPARELQPALFNL